MFELILFGVIALVAVVAAVGVVAQRNVLYSGLLLVVNFICLAALYIMMNAQFVGVVQIIVYAGAVMVLFLFAVMLLSGKRTEVVVGGLPGQRFLGALAVAVFAMEILALLGGGLWRVAAPPAAAAGMGNVQAVAAVLFTRYLWAFEATGLLLLVALVGVVYLVKSAPDAGARH